MSYVENLLTTNETILLQCRKHPIQLASGLIGLGVQVGFWLFLYFLLRLFGFLDVMAPVWDEISPDVVRVIPVLTFVWENLFFTFIWLIVLLGLGRYIRNVILWFNAYDILTNRRLIQVRGVLSKHVSETSLEKINDVNLFQTTFGRMLGYGNLTVMTASEAGISYLWYLPDPLDFKKAMMDAKEVLGGSNGRASAPSTTTGSDSITNRLAKLDALYQQNLITEQEYQARRSRILDEV